MITFLLILGFYNNAGTWVEKEMSPFDAWWRCMEYVSEMPTQNGERYWCAIIFENTKE